MSTIYPFPSHVSVQSFVTVKLSDKGMYGLWKKQMLYLLESHDMLGFISGITYNNNDYHMWKRCDALISGWILGSLFEHTAIKLLSRLNSKFYPRTEFTAKEIWDQVQMMFDQQADEEKEEQAIVLKEEEERYTCNKELYLAVSCGRPRDLFRMFNDGKVLVTDSISINGNTALHIVVANRTAPDDVLKSMLDCLPENIPLTEVRNLDGSTPLHLAASIGNTNAAKILVDKCPQLLSAKDNDGCTPLDIILSEPWNKETWRFFVNSTTTDIEHNASLASEEPLVNAISYEYFDLAQICLERYKSLKSEAVLMAIAQHCPADFTPYQLFTYELWQEPFLDFMTRDATQTLPLLMSRAVLAFPYKILISICMKLQVYKNKNKIMEKRQAAIQVLDTVCSLIKSSNDASSYPKFYTKPILEAIRRDASDVVERVVHWFPRASMVVDEDGNNITQAAWMNRASKVFTLIAEEKMAKRASLSQKLKVDHYGNTFLHLAARLAPARKLDLISSPPFQLQRELQWFKLATKMVPQDRMKENCIGETPEMVFTKEHKELVIESGKWMKSTAKSYAITATLIITVVFAATFIEPPRNKETEAFKDVYSKLAYILFEVSLAISMVTSSMSLLLFLAILTSRVTEQDFLFNLPRDLVIALVSLFVSAACTMLAFGAALFFIFGSEYPWTLGFISPLIGLPIIFFYYFYSSFLADYLYSTGEFLMINRFRNLNLLGRIYI